MDKLLTIVITLLAAVFVHNSSASTESTDSEEAQRPKIRGILLGHNVTPGDYGRETIVAIIWISVCCPRFILLSI
jgi:hypothetical protein